MNISKKLLVPGAIGLAAFAGVAGASALNSLPVSADSATMTAATTATATTAAATDSTATTPATQPDQSQGGHVGSNGTKEELLTGDTATKAKAAALAAVPGGTVLRVETDAEGATYEAHMTKSDGTQVTLKMDADFKVTSTEAGGPGGPRGSGGSTSTSNT